MWHRYRRNRREKKVKLFSWESLVHRHTHPKLFSLLIIFQTEIHLDWQILNCPFHGRILELFLVYFESLEGWSPSFNVTNNLCQFVEILRYRPFIITNFKHEITIFKSHILIYILVLVEGYHNNYYHFIHM